MSEKPILFSTPMIQAILENKKSVTRRVIKPQPTMYDFGPGGIMLAWLSPTTIEGYDAVGVNRVMETAEYLKCPYGKIGDTLWVRETWCRGKARNGDNKTIYKADIETDLQSIHEWKPSIHMPREAARLFLTVKNVRVERLQDITAEQIKKEGIQHFDTKPDETFGLTKKEVWFENPMYCFKWLWNSTIKKQDADKYGWEANPWVWAVEFERK